MYIYIYDACVFAVLKKLLPTNAACEDIKKKNVPPYFRKNMFHLFYQKNATEKSFNRPKVLQFLANNVLAPKAAAIEPMEEKVGEP